MPARSAQPTTTSPLPQSQVHSHAAVEVSPLPLLLARWIDPGVPE
jgi:hypothetical protein